MFILTPLFDINLADEKTSKFKPFQRGIPIPTGGFGPAPSADLISRNPSPASVSIQQKNLELLNNKQTSDVIKQNRSNKNPLVNMRSELLNQKMVGG